MNDVSNSKSDLKSKALDSSQLLSKLAPSLTSSDKEERLDAIKKLLQNLEALSQDLKATATQNQVDYFIDNVLIPKSKSALETTGNYIARTWWKWTLSLTVIGIIFSGISYFQQRADNGQGLNGNYYLGTNLEKLFDRRLDKKIDFKWQFRSPLSELSNRNFSVRWEGLIKTDQIGPHYFFTLSDDGVRLWIDDQLIIDNWTIHGSVIDNGHINLDPGFHKIEMEYFQGTGDNRIRLSWQRPGDQAIQVIPTKYLYPTFPAGEEQTNTTFKLGVSMGEALRATQKNPPAEKEKREPS